MYLSATVLYSRVNAKQTPTKYAIHGYNYITGNPNMVIRKVLELVN